MLAIAHKRLGLEAFGFAQVGIAAVEFCIPWIAFGYNQFGSIRLGHLSPGSRAEGALLSNVLTLKWLHSIICAGVLIAVCLALPEYGSYLSLALMGSVILFLAAIELLWYQVGRQRLVGYGLFVLGAKVLSLGLAYLLVDGPEDASTFAILTLSAGGITCLLTFLFYFQGIQWQRPSLDGMRRLFWSSRSFTMVAIYAVAVDRIDLMAVQHFFGFHDAGLYGGLLRLNNVIVQLVWAIGLVFFSEAIIARTTRELDKHVKMSLFGLASLLFPIVTGIWFTEQNIATMIYGPDFNAPYSVLSVLVLGDIGIVWTMVAGQQVLQIKNQIKHLLTAMILGLGTFTGCLWAFGLDNGLVGVAVSQASGKLVTGFTVLIMARRWLLELPGRNLWRPLLPSLIMGVALQVLGGFQWGLAATIFSGASIYMACYLVVNGGYLRRTILKAG